MSLSYLDKTGLTALWAKIKAKIPTKTSDLTNDSGFTNLTLGNTSITAAAGNHTHGSITNAGAITGTTGLANGDGIIFADSSDSSKLKRSSISFDGSTTTKALTQAGTWQTFTDNDGTVTSVTIKGTSPIVCSNSSAITDFGTRTISLDAGEARTALGTKYGILSKSQESVDVSSSTSAFTALDNISTVDGLTTGYWLVQATVNFQSNASGYRVAVLSQNNTISSANTWGTVIVGASPSDVTRVQVMALMNITSTTTPIHVFVKQNSGSKLTCATTMRALRLSL